MIDVRVGDEGDFFHLGKTGKMPAEKLQHLVAVAGKAAVHKQEGVSFLQHIKIAPAGRLYHKQAAALLQLNRVNRRAEGRPFPVLHEFRKPPNIIEGLQGGFLLFIQQLHQAVGMDEDGVGLFLRKAEDPAHRIGEGDIENRAV